jgi:hypothetical protein
MDAEFSTRFSKRMLKTEYNPPPSTEKLSRPDWAALEKIRAD